MLLATKRARCRCRVVTVVHATVLYPRYAATCQRSGRHHSPATSPVARLRTTGTVEHADPVNCQVHARGRRTSSLVSANTCTIWGYIFSPLLRARGQYERSLLTAHYVLNTINARGDSDVRPSVCPVVPGCCAKNRSHSTCSLHTSPDPRLFCRQLQNPNHRAPASGSRRGGAHERII